MKTHYAEPSLPTLTTTTDPENTCPWGKTHLSHARFSRREWGQSWRCPRSVGCTTATNDEPPETAKATCKLLMSLLKSLSKLLTLASLNSFHSLEYMTQTLVRFMVPPATAPAAVPDGIFVRDNMKLTLFLVVALSLVAAISAQPAMTQNAFTPDQVKWGPAPSFLAPGAQLAVIRSEEHTS